jgi:hypothetical protein
MAAAGVVRNGAWLAAGLALGAGVWIGLRTVAERAPWAEAAPAAVTAASVRPAAVGEAPAPWSPPGEGFLVPSVQLFLTSALGVGNQQVFPGKDGWRIGLSGGAP